MPLANIILGAALAGLVGFILAIPAIVVECTKKKGQHSLPVLVDVKPNWWPGLTHRELFFVGLFVHVVLSTLFGLIYVVSVEQGWLFITNDAYSILSLLLFAVGAWIVTGSVIFPVIGFGFFGRKEEGNVWAEIFATYLVLGIILWLLVQWFQPAYFSII